MGHWSSVKLRVRTGWLLRHPTWKPDNVSECFLPIRIVNSSSYFHLSNHHDGKTEEPSSFWKWAVSPFNFSTEQLHGFSACVMTQSKSRLQPKKAQLTDSQVRSVRLGSKFRLTWIKRQTRGQKQVISQNRLTYPERGLGRESSIHGSGRRSGRQRQRLEREGGCELDNLAANEWRWAGTDAVYTSQPLEAFYCWPPQY